MLPASNFARNPCHWLGRGLDGRRGRGFAGRRSRAVEGLLNDGAGDVGLPLTSPEPEQGLGDGIQCRFVRGSPQHAAQGVRRQQILDGDVVYLGELTQGCARLNQSGGSNRVTLGPGSCRWRTVGVHGERRKIRLRHLTGSLQRGEPLSLVSAN